MPKSDLTIIQLGAANEPFPINSRIRVSQPWKCLDDSSIKIALVKREEKQSSRIVVGLSPQVGEARVAQCSQFRLERAPIQSRRMIRFEGHGRWRDMEYLYCLFGEFSSDRATATFEHRQVGQCQAQPRRRFLLRAVGIPRVPFLACLRSRNPRHNLTYIVILIALTPRPGGSRQKSD